MKATYPFLLAFLLTAAAASTVQAQSALDGSDQSIGGQFGSSSFIGGDQTADATSQAILEQATGSSGSAFASGAGGSVLGGGTDTGLGNANNLGGLSSLGALGLGGAGRGFGGQQNFGQQPNNTAAGSSTSPVRVPIRLSPELRGSRRSGQVRATSFEKLLARLPAVPSADSVSIVLADQTAILRGVVATNHERDLIQRLAMLEPGVANVQNELTVPNSAEPPALPAP